MDFSLLICEAIAAATAFESGMECIAFAVAVICAKYENAAAVSNGTDGGTIGNCAARCRYGNPGKNGFLAVRPSTPPSPCENIRFFNSCKLSKLNRFHSGFDAFSSKFGDKFDPVLLCIPSNVFCENREVKLKLVFFEIYDGKYNKFPTTK